MKYNMMRNRWIRYLMLFLLTLSCLLGVDQSQVTAKDSNASTILLAECDKLEDCLQKARSYLDKTNDNKALEILEAIQAQTFSPDLDATKRAQILTLLGEIYIRRGDLPRATTAFTDSLALATKAVAAAEQSAALYGLALVENARLEAELPSDLFDPRRFPINAWPAFYVKQQKRTLDALQKFESSIAPLPDAAADVLQAKLGKLRLLLTQVPKFYQPWFSLGYTRELDKQIDLKPRTDQDLEKLKRRIVALEKLKQETWGVSQPYIEKVNQDLVAAVPAILAALPTASGARTAGVTDRTNTKAEIAARIHFAETLRRLNGLVDRGHQANLAYYQLVKKLADARAALIAVEQPAVPANSKANPQPVTKTKALDQTVRLLPEKLQAELTALAASSYVEAARQLGQAINLARQNQWPELAMQARKNLIQLYAQAEKWDQVGALIDAKLLLDADQVGAPELSGPLYGYYARMLKSKGKEFYGQALTASDLAIARIEAVRSDLLSIAPGIQYDYRNDVESFYRDNLELRLLNLPQGEDRQKELKLVLKRVELLQLAEIHNYFREPCIQAKTIALDQIIDQRSLSTAIIYPVMMTDQLGLVVRLPNATLEYVTAPVARKVLEDTASAWLANITKRDDAAKNEASQPYQWLVAPYANQPDIAAQLTKIDTFVFVLDGALRNIPMAALIDEKGRYLIQQKAVAVSPGLQLFDPNPITTKNLFVYAAGLKGKPSENYGSIGSAMLVYF